MNKNKIIKAIIGVILVVIVFSSLAYQFKREVRIQNTLSSTASIKSENKELLDKINQLNSEVQSQNNTINSMKNTINTLNENFQ